MKKVIQSTLVPPILILGFFLFFASLIRLIFFFKYAPQDLAFSVDILKAFTLGFRFDLASFCHILTIWTLLSFLILSLKPLAQKVYSQFFKIYFLTMTCSMILILSIDIGFYSYFQDHINILFFGFFEDDTWALIKTFWSNYPFITIICATLLFVMGTYFFLNKIKPENKAHPRLTLALTHFLFFIFVAIGARGSLGLFPLGPMNTAISENLFINQLSFNGIYSLARATELKLKYNHNFFPNRDHFGYSSSPGQSWKDMTQTEQTSALDYIKKPTATNEWAQKTKPHVVVIMVESLGAYWLKLHNEKNNLLGSFETHIKEDLFFTNFLSSSNATVGAIGSFLINTPQRPMGPYLTESSYLQVSFDTSPASVYKKAGYMTRFIYGGNPGWRDLNKFAVHQNFDSIEGEVQIQKTLGYELEKHDWGVHDHDVYNYILTLLKNAKAPQFIVVLTTTNHPPYDLPPSYKPLPTSLSEDLKPKLNTSVDLAEKRFLTYQYSNNALGDMMNEIKNTNLKDNTLVAATGDHNFWIVDFKAEEIFSKWAVPFYLYIPEAAKTQLKSIDQNTFGSHQDILPTLYELSLSNQDYYSFGKSLLHSPAPHYALHFSSFIASADGAVKVAGQGATSQYFTWDQDRNLIKLSEPPTESLLRMEKYYKATMSSLDDFFESERKKTLK